MGHVSGVDPREMQKSDLIVIWGGNPVNTQVNVMTHAMMARKNRGAKIACVDIYETGTMKQADVKLLIRPGTDGALACAVMHVLFRDGHADWAYHGAIHRCAARVRSASQDPHARVGIEDLRHSRRRHRSLRKAHRRDEADLFPPRLRLHARSRNGAVNMHAVTCIPAVTGAWQYEGGGALHSNSGMYRWNKTMIEGLDVKSPDVRVIDQSRIGAGAAWRSA